MFARLQDIRRNHDGFSLIEMLIVIVVLGILAGIVVLGVGTFRKDAAQGACDAEAKTVKVAASAYRAKTGSTIAGRNSNARIQTLVTQGYLESTPTYVANIALAADGGVTNTCSSLT